MASTTDEQDRGTGDAEAPGRRRPGRRLTEQERSALVERVAPRYTGGASIRQIAAEEGLSYGFVHRLLSESDVELRGRGGSTRRAAAS
ncbi:helix-turn-helix domain-containing protein [Pseudokineococcus sp. 1T1Z-3]|uniref:helix-turn-helix domain-containing protein n=1 Tax=Pseudokineococcus sp. 1T1Z-3 TaxID=3132745 RepID=UPI00309AFFF3